MDDHAISFGPFRLLAAQRLLLEGDTPVRLGSRAFDILAALVERAGEVVGKQELIARAWPQTFIEESNLKIQISVLRRALGDGQGGHRYVVTVPGRGYNFVAPVSPEEPFGGSPRPTISPTQRLHNLPAPVTRMIGREGAVAALVSRLPDRRLVTIVGPGGIGKTTVALAVAEQMTADYQHGVWLIDLAPLGDPSLVPSTVAGVLGLEGNAEDLLPGLVANLSAKRMLLLLDTCEHVMDATVRLAAAVLRGAPGVNILATSREPFGVVGEHQYRLGPLSRPPSSELSAAEAAIFPAVQLFVERVCAVVEDFALTDANAPLIAEICRRLDGSPLAIEFAAPRVEVLGIEGLAAHLVDSLPVLTARRRTSAVPRHRTMRAVLDWSYRLLREDEQQFFRALGIFAGGFTVEAAAATARAVADECDAIDRLADLVAKSLVVADVSGIKPRFRLLDTTRAYAIEKLEEGGELERIARRHAEYYRDLFERAEREALARPTGEWLADYAGEIDNLRAALDWALSPSGDGSIGVALTVGAIPLLLQLPRVDECRSRVEQVLALPECEAPIDARSEMKLQAALGASLLFTKGAIPAARQACTAALHLADSFGDAEYQFRALSELWAHHTNTGEFAAALTLAQRFYTLALEHADPATLPIADRILSISYHYLGDQTNTWRYVERMLSDDADPQRRSQFIRFRFDQKVAGRVVLARVLWLRGFADQAWRAARTAVADAEALADPATLCYALSHGGCLVALWVGDFAAAERYVEMLLEHSRENGFAIWNDFASRLKEIVLVKTGDLDGGLLLLRGGLNKITEFNSGLWFLTALGEMAEALGRLGRFADALATVERGIDRSQRGWLAPELLRINGELLLAQSTTETTQVVKDLFLQALDGAREQGSLSWELRAATSLARLLRDQNRPTDAIDCLRPTYDRFTEGFNTADLVAAKQLLNELGTPDRE